MKYMGKILLAIALLMLLCGMASAETVASGYCGHGGDGTTLSWILTGEGTLTISGSGATATYSPQNRPPWFEYASQIKKVVLEGTIRTLGDYVFAEHPALEEIELPDSVQYINSYAFYETGLKSIHFPQNVKVINTYAFADCQLESVILPEKASYGRRAFLNNPVREIIIPEGVTKLAEDMFAILTSSNAEGHVETIVIPSTLSNIPDSAFGGVKIEHITIPGTVKTIGESAFFACARATVEEGVSSLGDYSFYSCRLLDLPVSVTTLGKEVTRGAIRAPKGSVAYEYARMAINGAAIALASDDLPYNTGIGYEENTCKVYAYYGDDEVVTIPDTINGMKVDAIGSEIFKKTPFVKEVFLPDGEIRIDFALGEGANGPVKVHLGMGNVCYELSEKKMTSIFYVEREHEFVTNRSSYLASNATKDCKDAFLDTIPTIILEDWEQQPFVYTIKDGKCTIVGYHGLAEKVKIPAKIDGYPVTELGYRSFMGSVARDVTIPDTVKKIGAEAFWMVKYPDDLLIRMPESVSTFGKKCIPDRYFSESEIYPGPIVLYTLESPFDNKMPADGGRLWDGVGAAYEPAYFENEDGKVKLYGRITGYFGEGDTAELPTEIEQWTIKILGQHCFNGGSKTKTRNGDRHYKTIIVPEGIVESKNSFLNNCADHIYLPKSLKTLEIDPRHVPKVTFHVYKDSYAYQYLMEKGGFNIQIIYEVDLRLPQALERIEEEAFDGNTQFEFVEISENISYVGARAFRNCSNLKYAYFLGMDTVIGEDAFAGCDLLTIVCREGSSAEAYARANGIDFIRPDELQ